jgi:hypothetical protein
MHSAAQHIGRAVNSAHSYEREERSQSRVSSRRAESICNSDKMYIKERSCLRY